MKSKGLESQTIDDLEDDMDTFYEFKFKQS